MGRSLSWGEVDIARGDGKVGAAHPYAKKKEPAKKRPMRAARENATAEDAEGPRRWSPGMDSGVRAGGCVTE